MIESGLKQHILAALFTGNPYNHLFNQALIYTGCRSDMMTDKVRIDTLSANSLPQSNDTFLARQAEFESNVRSYPRKLPLAIAKAQGVWITDVENNQYLDCPAGAGTPALGHNHPEVLQSIQSVITSGLPLHTLDLTTPLKDEFSSYLLSLLPGGAKSIACSSPGRPVPMPLKRR